MKKVYLLVDCNNFFVSCERVFKPALKNKPVMVLSNNDGCVISRSNEVKKFGVPMGAPVFKYRDLIKKYNIRVFSTNFTLYGDMSNRVMETLEYFTDDLEIYSVDEAFFKLNQWTGGHLENYGRLIKTTVQKWTGIPVSIGIGSTKTLAKAANELAKKHEEFSGVLSLVNNSRTDQLLAQLAIGDVWGIGRAYRQSLPPYGLKTALDLKNAPDFFIKEKMGVMGERTVLELRGVSCVELDHGPTVRKTILTSRSFRDPLTSLSQLKKAIAKYVSRAAEKLREQGSVAGSLNVFITTSRFKKDNYYSNSANTKFLSPTSYTPTMIASALKNLEKIFKPGCLYKRAGVLLTDISSTDNIQLNFFNPYSENKKQQRLMASLDEINDRWGGDTVKSAAMGVNRIGRYNVLKKSASYTTKWLELMVVQI
ncbi:MAG TPA: Y-family DNA polymerase [Patescibacteria group bacterium]